MENYFSLNIKTPCSENFDSFAPTKKGGFCESCKHEVIDFTQMNARQIIYHFETNTTQNTCGRFKITQLDIDLHKSKRISFWSGIGLACLSFFSLHSIHAQGSVKTIDTTNKNPSDIKASQFENNIVVKGFVSDGQVALPGVNVILEGTTTGTQTNFDGEFEFPRKLKKGDVLVFSYLGMTSQKAVISDQKSTLNVALKIDMTECEMIMVGKVAVKQVYKSKKD